MSRMASMKKAASKEKSEMNEETAYNGTMTMMRTTILEPGHECRWGMSAKKGGIPLEKRFSVVS